MLEKLSKEIMLLNEPRIYVNDKRITTLFHSDYPFQIKKYNYLEEWEARKKDLKNQILISAGLWPLPKKCDLNAEITDCMEFGDFTIKKVKFESYPGFFVTGNLFLPLGKKGPFPAIMNAHGHYQYGRLEHSRFSDIPTRCSTFAKNGMIAFAYDMIGWQDSIQIAHDYGGYIEEMWNMGAFGLQLWNSIRVVDFLISLEEVDPARIACTGASGGATQTIMIAAVDDRIKATAPVDMISAHMQGGCPCENAAGLRIGTNNVEIAAMTAPRPMFLYGCTNDWTQNTPDVEYPAIRSFYELYDATDKFDYFFEDGDHDYNWKVREKVYAWFVKHLAVGNTPCCEQKIEFGDVYRLKLFDTKIVNAKPDFRFSMEFSNQRRKEKAEVLDKLMKNGNHRDKSDVRTAMDYSTGICSTNGSVIAKKKDSRTIDKVIIDRIFIGTEIAGEQIPAAILHTDASTIKKALLMLHPLGKAAVMAAVENRNLLEDALDRGYHIVLPDLFLTGEYNKPYCQAGRSYTNIRPYFTTFNYTDDALRIHDIVTICNYLKLEGFKEITVFGLSQAGLLTLAALPYLGKIKKIVADMEGVDILCDVDLIDHFYLPGFCSSGGFTAAILLGEPDELILYNIGDSNRVEQLKAVYSDLKKSEKAEFYLKSYALNLE